MLMTLQYFKGTFEVLHSYLCKFVNFPRGKTRFQYIIGCNETGTTYL